MWYTWCMIYHVSGLLRTNVYSLVWGLSNQPCSRVRVFQQDVWIKVPEPHFLSSADLVMLFHGLREVVTFLPVWRPYSSPILPPQGAEFWRVAAPPKRGPPVVCSRSSSVSTISNNERTTTVPFARVNSVSMCVFVYSFVCLFVWCMCHRSAVYTSWAGQEYHFNWPAGTFSVRFRSKFELKNLARASL